MIKAPERLTISQEREEKLKKQYGYSKVYVYSPSFLSEYIDKIVSIFPNPEQQEIIRKNMSQISEFVIGDRFNAGLGRLSCSKDSIHMEESLANITDTSFSVAEGCEYLETIFIHELLHAAARRNQGNMRNLSGVVEFVYDKDGNAVGRKNIGLNEGITQLLAEKISKQVVSDEIDSYAYNKKVVALLADVLGSNVITSSYFEHSDALKDAMNKLANNPEYYDKFNKKLDTINKLEATVRKIKRGQITPKDPDSLARMEAVLEAQKEALMESVFANIVIPQIQKQDIKERQNILINLSMHHSAVLKTVQKYIPNIQNTTNAFEDMSDERLAKIQEEIAEFGIDFTKMQEAASKVNETHKLGPRIAKDLIGAIDTFYEENADMLKVDRSSTLTPMLRKQLEGFVDKLDVLEAYATTEQDKKNVEGFKNFLKAYFHKIPDLDLEIEKIREERKAKKASQPQKVEAQKEPVKKEEAPVVSDDVQAVLDEAKRAGEEAARIEAHEHPNPPEEAKEEPKQARKFGLNDVFVVDNITGEVINQKNATMYEKVRNITKATGEFDYHNEPEIAKKRAKSANNFTGKILNSLDKKTQKELEKKFGKEWPKVIQQAYVEGYNRALDVELGKARLEGQSLRAEEISRTNEVERKISPVSFEEVKFVFENFDIKTKDDGLVEIVDKVTGQIVTSKATITKALFANEWVNAAGAIQKEDGTIEIHPELAFSNESRDMYRFVQVQAGNDLRNDGAINLPELTANAEAMGGRYESVSRLLFRNETVSNLVDSHFRMQTPDAKAKVDAPQVEAPVEEKGTHR